MPPLNYLLPSFFWILAAWHLTAQQPYLGNLSAPSPAEQAWVDSTMASMTFEQQVGQLFMVRAHSDKGRDHEAAVEGMIRDQQVGGLCFFQGTPDAQLKLVNRYQNLSRIPLLVSMDAEWGLGMRLQNTMSFPRQLAMGAMRDNSLIYEMGSEVARQLRRVGVNVSFSPVLDVNNNPDNPIINTRSFGEDRYQVAAKGYSYMRGLQDNGVMACAKHFPGHGDTDVDSHSDLPVIRHDRRRLDSVELFPFQALVRYGIGSFMIAHLNVPTLDERENRPTTLSERVVTDLLRNQMHFEGLIFTDAMEMEGVRKFFPDGVADAEALRAGNDMVLLPNDLDAALRAVDQYLEEGKLDSARLQASTRRVLLAKYRLGLANGYSSRSLANLDAELNTPYARNLKLNIYQEALTLLRDDHELLPIDPAQAGEIIYLQLGDNGSTPLLEHLGQLTKIKKMHTAAAPSAAQINQLVDAIPEDAVVIAPVYSDGSRFRERVTLSTEAQQMLERLDRHARLVVVHLGNPYDLGMHDGLSTVLCTYTSDPLAQEATADALLGIIGVSGRLPVTVSERAPYNAGLSYTRSYRMGYAPPNRVGVDGEKLVEQMDEVAAEAMRKRATPGMVVLVARHGRIVMEKAYGYHTYNRRRPVQTDDLYDLASVTKVAATTLAMMRLYEEGEIDLDTPISTYLPELDTTNKRGLNLRDILAHRSGLRSWIPFYDSTLVKERNSFKRDSRWYSQSQGGDFSVPVTERIYMNRHYVDTMWQKIHESPLPNLGQYYYSDLGFYLMAQLVDRLTGRPLDQYVREEFYEPLGIPEMGYNPHRRFDLSRIPPTERDNYFRTQVVHGYVHDMGAAMLGGVSGHAGLFGKARDLAVIFQMLLQDGYYGNRRYFKPETVRLFTTRWPGELRRGLGFDMKQLNPLRNMNMSELASERAFGHLGFTGTAVWADPETDLVFVFLSNRTYPSMKNRTLGRINTRPKAFTAAINSVIH